MCIVYDITFLVVTQKRDTKNIQRNKRNDFHSSSIVSESMHRSSTELKTEAGRQTNF